MVAFFFPAFRVTVGLPGLVTLLVAGVTAGGSEGVLPGSTSGSVEGSTGGSTGAGALVTLTSTTILVGETSSPYKRTTP